jgi:hypothetical protein
MKNKLIILLLGVLGVFLFTTCKKDPKLPIPALQSGVIPKLLKVDTKDATINFFDLAAFNGSFTVDTYYADKPTSIEIWVTFNGNKAKRALVQTVTSFPTTVDVTVAGLSSLLSAFIGPADLVAGAYFKFYTVINMKDGTVSSAFDPNYAQFNTSILNLPGSATNLTYTIVCPLNLSDFVGDYTMDDGSPSDLCTISFALDPDNADGFIINNFYVGTGVGVISPIKFKVNRATYGISLNPSPQVFATYLWNPAYKNGTLANLSGTLDACTLNFSFRADLSATVSFGPINYTCTRN